MQTLILLAICTAMSVQSGVQARRDLEIVRHRLVPLQMISFATDREYCGYLVRRTDGTTGFTPMIRGNHDGCTPDLPSGPDRVIASVRTHGAYDPTVPAEFPTVLDLDSDAREGVDGYVATPGGRLWFIDGAKGVAYQICGLGCLPQDPAFHAGDDGEIASRYSRADLAELEAAGAH